MLLPRGLWLADLERLRFTIKDHHPSSLLTLWSVFWLSSDHMTDKKCYIYTSVRPMAKKPDRAVSSNVPKSQNLFITCSHKVIQQMKNVINSFSRDLWLWNLTQWWLTIRSHRSNNKVTYHSDHAVAWGHVTNELHYKFILRSLLNLTGWWLVNL